MAILITITVLGLRDHKDDTWNDLRQALPTALIYLADLPAQLQLHRHLLEQSSQHDRRHRAGQWHVVVGESHLRYWLSLVPWTTSWLGCSHFARVPTAYGISLLVCAVAYSSCKQRSSACRGRDRCWLLRSVGIRRARCRRLCMWSGSACPCEPAGCGDRVVRRRGHMVHSRPARRVPAGFRKRLTGRWGANDGLGTGTWWLPAGRVHSRWAVM